MKKVFIAIILSSSLLTISCSKQAVTTEPVRTDQTTTTPPPAPAWWDKLKKAVKSILDIDIDITFRTGYWYSRTLDDNSKEEGCNPGSGICQLSISLNAQGPELGPDELFGVIGIRDQHLTMVLSVESIEPGVFNEQFGEGIFTMTGAVTLPDDVNENLGLPSGYQISAGDYTYTEVYNPEEDIMLLVIDFGNI